MELNLDTIKPYHLGTAVGFIIGLVLFFNLPSFSEMVLKVGLFSIIGGGSVKLARDPDLKVFIIVIFAVLVFLVTSNYIPLQCPLYEVLPSPAENPFTGEVTSEFDGFRWQRCDKGEHPWYFRDL